MDYQRLLSEHDRIDQLCRVLIRSVTTECPDPGASLQVRADLSAELDAHLAHEDSFLYPREAVRNGTPVQIAEAFVDEFADLTQDWKLYLREWSEECIDADWTTFRSETVTLVRRLRARVQRENEVLYPAALRSGAITLRPAVRTPLAIAG